MCTMIAHQAKIAGSGKGTQGWFDLCEATVSFDHPFHVRLEHALNIDFVNEAEGPSARVAVELTPASARALAQTILATLDEAEAGGWKAEYPDDPRSHALSHAHNHSDSHSHRH